MRLLRDLLSLLITGLLSSAVVAGSILWLEDYFARRDCFSAAGRVEHYDGDRPDVWRCIGARTEGE